MNHPESKIDPWFHRFDRFGNAVFPIFLQISFHNEQ